MNLPGVSIPLPTILWIIWGCVFLAWIGTTSIVLYHWRSYARTDRRVHRMKIIYLVLSFLLFVSAASFIFSL